MAANEIVEVVFRTIISVNQLSIYGAVADMCDEPAWEISKCSEGTGRPAAPNDSETMALPTEFSTTNETLPTDERVQGDLLRDYEQKFANLPVHLKLTKLCSNAGLANTVEKGQYFSTLDDAELDKLKGSCREYTLPRSDKSSVTYHQGRCGVEIMINSPFGDGTRSWVGIVNGINKYVTEMSEETHIENIGKTETDTKFDVILYDDSSAVSWAEMDRRWTRKIRRKLSGSIEIDDQCAATWRHHTSRKWRGMQIPRPGINISFRIFVFFALVNLNMDKFLAKRRWKQEEIPMLRGSQFTWKSSIPSINSRPFWWKNIARQCVVTERLRRAHLSRWKLPWLTLHLDWFRKGKSR